MRLCVKELSMLNIQRLHTPVERNSRTGSHAQLGRGLSFVIKAATFTLHYTYLIHSRGDTTGAKKFFVTIGKCIKR